MSRIVLNVFVYSFIYYSGLSSPRTTWHITHYTNSYHIKSWTILCLPIRLWLCWYVTCVNKCFSLFHISVIISQPRSASFLNVHTAQRQCTWTYPVGNGGAFSCWPGASTWTTAKCCVISCMSSKLKSVLKHDLSVKRENKTTLYFIFQHIIFNIWFNTESWI